MAFLSKLVRPWKLVRPTSLMRTEPFTMAAVENEECEVIVIGGGCAGSAAALRAVRMGFKTTCIEKKGFLGSVASYQVLLKCEYAIVNLRNMPRLLAHRAAAAASLSKGIEGMFKITGVNYIKGFARFVSPSQVFVDTLDGEKVVVKGKHIIIATGSYLESSLPGNVTIDEKKIISSTGALSLLEIPKRAVLVGSSYNIWEIASVWRWLGSKVTIVDSTPDEYLRMGPALDCDANRKFKQMIRDRKVGFLPDTKVVGVDASSTSGVKLTVQSVGGGQLSTLDADGVVIPERRVPNIDGLCLENIAIDIDLKADKIEVDEGYMTSVPGVYAIGDIVTGGPMGPAAKATEDGIACVELIAGKGKRHNCGKSVIKLMRCVD